MFPGVLPFIISVQGDGLAFRGLVRLAFGLAVQLNRHAVRTDAILIVVVVPDLLHRDVRFVELVVEGLFGVNVR